MGGGGTEKNNVTPKIQYSLPQNLTMLKTASSKNNFLGDSNSFPPLEFIHR